MENQMSEVNNNLLNEIWKAIPDYELEYAISNLGRVKRLKESTARSGESQRGPSSRKNFKGTN